MSLLIKATKEKNVNLVRQLILENVNLDIQDDNGYSALMYASINEDFDMVKLLLENGANPNIYTPKFKNALFLSLEKSENTQIVDFLAYYGSDLSKLNHDALSICLSNNYSATTQCLLDKYYDINSKKMINLMLWAIQYKKNEAVEMLLLAGFNIYEIYNKETFFEMAIKLNHFKVCELFIKNGYDINFKNPISNESILIKALCQSKAEIVSYLFSQGLKITNDDQSKKKNYLAHIKQHENLELAINNGLEINELDIDLLSVSKPELAAILCLKLKKIKTTIVNKIMRSLRNQQKFDLMKDLLKVGYKLPEGIKHKVPEDLKSYALSLEEKELLDKMIKTDMVTKRVKI